MTILTHRTHVSGDNLREETRALCRHGCTRVRTPVTVTAAGHLEPMWGLVYDSTLPPHLFAFCPSSQLPAVFHSDCEFPEFLQASLLEDPATWSQIMKDSVPMKISVQLRGEDGSIWNYQPPSKSDGKEIIPLLPHLADVSTYMFKGVINFAKVISHFR